MKFDWTEYLNLAKELYGQRDSAASNEAKLRSAVSRAYYSAFCKVRNYCRDVKRDNRLPNDARVHKYIINKFKQSENRRYRQIGINLDRLRADRNKADYHDVVQGLPSMVSTDLRRAQKVISILNTI